MPAGHPLTAFSSPQFLRVDQDRDKDCSLECGGSPQKPLCASDGRTFLSRCEFQRAKCKDPQLEVAHRGSCRGEGGACLGLQWVQGLGSGPDVCQCWGSEPRSSCVLTQSTSFSP